MMKVNVYKNTRKEIILEISIPSSRIVSHRAAANG